MAFTSIFRVNDQPAAAWVNQAQQITTLSLMFEVSLIRVVGEPVSISALVGSLVFTCSLVGIALLTHLLPRKDPHGQTGLGCYQ